MKRIFVAAVSLLGSANALFAQGPVVLREPYTAGASYAVRVKVDLAGRLSVPAEKGKPAPTPMNVTGSSTIEYDERLLEPLPDRPGPRSVRFYRQAEFRRTVGAQIQSTRIRPSVRRMVVLRFGTREIPFSPDGPLTFGEIDMVRTDVYTPALVGLLPARAVQVGDRWPASATAVEELTDMEKIDEGGLECRLESIGRSSGRRVANVKFSGSVRGVNEDGPNKQQLDGTFVFDLESNFLTALELTGVHLLLDAQGQSTGRIEGKFQLARRTAGFVQEIGDNALKGLVLEPNSANILLVYDGSTAGVRFLYPRRWRVSAENGRQITLDEAHGNGVLITADSLVKTPSASEYLKEAHDFLTKQQGRLLRADPPQRLQQPPREVERFGMDVELNQQAARMEYFIVRQAAGGATVAARLVPKDAAVLRPEVEEIMKSLTISASGAAGVVPLPGK